MRWFIAVCTALALLAAPAFAGPPADQVRAAVDKGVAYLKNNPGSHNDHGNGRQALAGLALLAGGCTPADADVARIAGQIRGTCVGDDATYHVALSLLFLDKLGDPADEGLIQLLGVKLLFGQNAGGGWTYQTGGGVFTDAGAWRDKVRGRLTPGRLHPELAKVLQSARSGAGGGGQSGDDNSNTQFAVIALWVAGRHAVPIRDAAARIEARFLRTQSPADHGWAYSGGSGASSPSMTCAGLLGLAVATGVKLQAEAPKTDPDKDKEDDPFARPDTGGTGPDGEKKETPDVRKDFRTRAIERGVAALGRILAGQAAAIGGGGGFGSANDLYFFWSVERVGVAYEIDKMGGVNWYDWGAPALLSAQQPNGSWTGSYGDDVSTSFAILFLTRANLAADLSARIKGKVISGELRAGGPKADKIAFVPNPESGPRPANAPALAPVRSGTEADLIAIALVEAGPADWEKRLKAAKENKGVQYTAALVLAANRLERDKKKQVRDALVERLYRMTPETLRAMSKANEPELRRAACLAGAMRDDKTHIPDLIARITDVDDGVVRAARAGLKSLTGEDFGPDANATDEAKQQAAVRWKFWYSTEGQKK
jgi:hypothetical protein